MRNVFLPSSLWRRPSPSLTASVPVLAVPGRALSPARRLSRVLGLVLGLALAVVGNPLEAKAAQTSAASAAADGAERSRGKKFDGSWKQTRNKNGIRVYKRDMPDSKLLSFKGVGVIDAPVDVVLSIILDQERLSEWAEDRSRSRVVSWIKQPTDYVSYDRIELPWPLKDREFVTKVQIRVDPKDGRTRVSYLASQHRVGQAEDTVRGSLVGSYYILEPVDGGRKTRATGVAIADPKGNIPAWVVNLYQRGWPYDTLMAIRDQAKKSDIVVLKRLRPLYAAFRERLAALGRNGVAQSKATTAVASASGTAP